MSDRPKAKPSGEHAAVKRMRAKFDSMQEGTLPEVEALNARIAANLERAKSKHPDALPQVNTDIMPVLPEDETVKTPKAKDPRREDDSSVPDDVVVLEEPDPFPSDPPAPESRS